MAQKSFIEYLQGLPKASKRKVLVASVVVIMTIIVFFWIAYFNSMIAAITESSTQSPSVEETAQGVDIWHQFTGGMGLIYSQFSRAAQGLSDIFQAPRQYIVEPLR